MGNITQMNFTCASVQNSLVCRILSLYEKFRNLLNINCSLKRCANWAITLLGKGEGSEHKSKLGHRVQHHNPLRL